MIYLITGANGSAKTAITLRDVRALQVAEGRPVCHNGRSRIAPDGELSSWKQIDFKDWANEPDGTIFFIDEAQDDMPTRGNSRDIPAHISELAKHRHRGFDFYLVTPHPKLIDSYVRGLIGAPSWHKHNKRVFGGNLVSVAQYGSVNINCEANGAGAKGDVQMVPIPKEVYSWYTSASLHTAKRKLPWRVWAIILLPLLAIIAIYFAVQGVYGNATKQAKPADIAASKGVDGEPAARPGAAPVARVSYEQYMDDRKPRLADFPHTAPVYDEVTKPRQAPYPAACISMGKTCKCYTQQATLMQVSGAVCLQIVQQGFFMEWADPPQYEPPPRPQMLVQANGPIPAQQGQPQARPGRTVPMPDVAPPDPTRVTQSDVVAGLRKPVHAKFGGGGL
jgi:zona occludens toxin